LHYRLCLCNICKFGISVNSLLPSSFTIIIWILLLEQFALLVSLRPLNFLFVIFKLLIFLNSHFVNFFFHVVVHFLWSGNVVILLYSLKLGCTLLGEDCLDGGVSLVCSLGFTYLS